MTSRKKSAGTPPSTAKAEPVTKLDPSPSKSSATFPIVGLGASAGGLEAFEQFFRSMPIDSGLAFVLVQHLDPSHTSILTEILQRSTTMPVVEAQDQMAVAPNHVYVIPPSRDMLIFHGVLQLSVPTEPRGQRMPIDAFLRSLAEDQGENAIGVILSGTGTDGTLGLRAIYGAGGLCLAQDPSAAKYDGMPRSAIAAGYTTQILPADQMAPALQFSKLKPRPRQHNVPATGMSRILMLLRSGSGHDFSQYKKSTIGRRIERRMMQHNIEDAEVYARYMKEHPTEREALFHELLINVTSFFRDPEAFAVLKDDILPPMLASKPESYVFRIWIAGCATGEEAYSIAMVVREILDDTGQNLKVQLYSTDLDEDAITTARAGLYPPNIAQDVTPDRLRRFFIKEEAGYRIKKEIRDLVVFAVQSVIKDPPFTRLDLLACRNLMIYLEPELQNRLIPAFHYALKPGGVLFLSPSESIGSHTDLFEPIHRKWKLYRAMATPASTQAILKTGLSWTTGSTPSMPQNQTPRAKEPHIAELAKRMLMQSFAPASVVTDLQGNILYVHGDTSKYLRPAPGQPSHNVVDMAKEGLQLELIEALRQAASQGLPTLNHPLSVKTDGTSQAFNLSVRLMPDPDAEHSVLLVSFQDMSSTTPAKPARKPRGKASTEALRIAELELEVATAKENMSSMLEEQQASNEELKSTNEELQSTNEELQSTNEELETSKEELQSVNEELVTVNAELQTKVEQMAVMQDDMKNLLENIRIGTIFLDRHLHIRRFTREALKVYRLVATDVGRPLADIRSGLQGDDLLADAQTVLDSLVPIEREVCTANGTWYVARIQPYRTVDNVIDGVVLTFADVTERVAAIAARKARNLAEAIVDTLPRPLLVLDDTLKVISANHSFYKAFGGTPADTAEHHLFDINHQQWDFPEFHQLLDSLSPREKTVARRELTREFPGLGVRQLLITVQHVVEKIDQVKLVLLTIETLPTHQA